MTRPIQVIFNADDFGRSASINAAVMRAHREGVLTSASLMVAGEAAAEAVEFARATPTLAVGLHLVVVAGPAVLPPSQIPHLVDPRGYLLADPFRLGVLYAFNRAAREELAREMRAQFERFAATGLPLSHVDGHLHMHLHPTVLNLLLPLAKEYGARGFRLPRDDFWLALRHDPSRAPTMLSWAIVFGLLNRWALKRCHAQGPSPTRHRTKCPSHAGCAMARRRPICVTACQRHRLRNCGLTVAHRVYGLMQTGRMRESYLVALLKTLQVPTAEIYFHPSLVFEGNALGPNPGDLAALLSPIVRQVIQERNLKLATYPMLGDTCWS